MLFSKLPFSSLTKDVAEATCRLHAIILFSVCFILYAYRMLCHKRYCRLIRVYNFWPFLCVCSELKALIVDTADVRNKMIHHFPQQPPSCNGIVNAGETNHLINHRFLANSNNYEESDNVISETVAYPTESDGADDESLLLASSLSSDCPGSFFFTDTIPLDEEMSNIMSSPDEAEDFLRHDTNKDGDPDLNGVSTKRMSVETKTNTAGREESLLLASRLFADNLPDPAIADAVIAREMSNLSSNDLERAYFDIHGIVSNNNVMDETAPQPMDQSAIVYQLQQAVERIPGNSAFLQAKQLDSTYVGNRDFLLMFLQAEQFNVNAAAERLALHFEVKLELFGPDKLALDITQDDLDQEAMDALYSGLSQVLQERDRSGRSIVVFNANHGQQSLGIIGKVIQSLAGCVYYQLECNVISNLLLPR